MGNIKKIFIVLIAILSVGITLPGCNADNSKMKKEASDPVGQALSKGSHDTSSPLNSHPIDNP